MINDLRKQLNVKQIAEDMATFVIEDLKEEGFDAKLIKHNEKKPQTWKIVPCNELSEEDMLRFNELKEEFVTMYRDGKLDYLKSMKKAVIGK